MFPIPVKEPLLSWKVRTWTKGGVGCGLCFLLVCFAVCDMKATEISSVGEELSSHKLKEIFTRSLIERSRALLGRNSVILLDFIDNLNCGLWF